MPSASNDAFYNFSPFSLSSRNNIIIYLYINLLTIDDPQNERPQPNIIYQSTPIYFSTYTQGWVMGVCIYTYILPDGPPEDENSVTKATIIYMKTEHFYC